jgi:hypothetical protein
MPKAEIMDGFFENKYFNTYYYSNIISNILSRDVELIGFISNFFADEEIILHIARPFKKDSAFHAFIQHIIADFFSHDMDQYDQRIFSYYTINKYPLEPLYAESALKVYGRHDYSFKDYLDERTNNKSIIEYSDIEAYHDELMLTGRLEDLYEEIADEVFYIMFNNREALLEFNYIVAEHMDININDIEDADIRKLFNKKGHLKRVKIPEWCKKAVFFRDRGRCCLCTADLSGTLSINSKKHYDHIISLAKGGLNDVSNIQLLCSKCNLEKNMHKIITSSYYEKWF